MAGGGGGGGGGGMGASGARIKQNSKETKNRGMHKSKF